jgi:hypothetical protein
MRLFIGLASAALAVTAFLPSQVPDVVVHAECTGGKLAAHSVDPDTVAVDQGSDIDWELDGSSTATDLAIQPKHPGHWPFAHDAHFSGGKGHEKRAHASGNSMNAHAAGSYPYSIELSCPDGHGGSATVEIDPTIIVHGG